jgi:hypothetical protein
MDLEGLRASLQQAAPPADLNEALVSLWYAAKGDWNTAHTIAQEIQSRDGSWVHAYLHRQEGDLGNAAYWYRRAQRPVATGSLDDEWAAIVQALLQA